jgi:hypothetical protein
MIVIIMGMIMGTGRIEGEKLRIGVRGDSFFFAANMISAGSGSGD